MQISASRKACFFHEISQLLAGGIIFPKAIETLASGRGRFACAEKLARFMAGGLAPAEAFRAAGWSAEDCASIEAGFESGHIETLCGEMSRYYERLAEARRKALGKCLYPVLMLHLAPFLLAMPGAIIAGSMWKFIISVFSTLGVLYLAALLVWILWKVSLALCQHNATFARAFTWLPILGTWVAASAASRFASVFALLLGSGSNILRALELAGQASRFAPLTCAAHSAIQAVRTTGANLTDTLATHSATPLEISRAIQLGEKTGDLDIEMRRAATALDAAATRRLDLLAEWLPKLLYFAMLVYVSFAIIHTVLGIGHSIGNVLDFE